MSSTDRDALVALFQSTGGADWTNKKGWNSSAKLSTWFGVSVNGEGRVNDIFLHQNNLRGPIPSDIGNLIALEELHLGLNQINGSIPPEIANLTALRALDICFNKLRGPIPTELGALTDLQDFMFAHNQLTGCIPRELGALNKLQRVYLNGNQLTGCIPRELGGLNNVRSLILYGDRLSALWDHTEDVNNIGREEEADSASDGLFPSQLRRLLDVLEKGSLLEPNPWVEPPESIVSKGLNGIRSYFEDLYAEPCRVQRNSIKIILVGQEGAGKTSLRQSMKANEATPTNKSKEESTVFADVESMKLEDTCVRLYDCAGQVAYTGLLQMFLTPRSVCVLACNVDAFVQQRGSISDAKQLSDDVGVLEKASVLDWIRSMSRRVPGSDVILVATKCDLAGGNAKAIGRRIEHACRRWLKSWVRDGMLPVRMEEGVCLTSCCSTATSEKGEASEGVHAPQEGWACDWREGTGEDPSVGLLHRLVNKPGGRGLRGAQMVLPRSWDVALTVLEGLERGSDPVDMVMRKLADPDRGEAIEMAEPNADTYQGITVQELDAKWQETVFELERRKITITNPKHALEGALSIREFDGSLVRHEKFIFLDVVWLATILKPLLNHKDEETFDGSVNLGDTGDARITLDDPLDIASWHKLKREGILEPRLAHAMWPAGLCNYVLQALASLDLTFPLENDPAGGLVVLLRLGVDRPVRAGKVMDTFCSTHTPAFSANWKIFLGAPAGAIEKLLTRCCSIGGVRTFWRYGVLVHGGLGDGDVGGLFAAVLEYSSGDNMLSAQVHGDISTPAPWAALSYVISAVRLMLLEFPGLRSRGSLQCPQHGDSMPLSNTACRAGEKLLEDRGCSQCSTDTRGLGTAAVEVLRMVGTRLDRDTMFDEVKARFIGLKPFYSFPHPSTSSTDENVLIEKIDGLTVTVGDVKGGMEGGFDEIKGEMKGGFDEMNGTLNKVAENIQESLMRLRNLQDPNYPYPHLVIVKEIRPNGTSSRVPREKGPS